MMKDCDRNYGENRVINEMIISDVSSSELVKYVDSWVR